jgi:hypothetical protein
MLSVELGMPWVNVGEGGADTNPVDWLMPHDRDWLLAPWWRHGRRFAIDSTRSNDHRGTADPLSVTVVLS